jgi:hypothetical protein
MNQLIFAVLIAAGLTAHRLPRFGRVALVRRRTCRDYRDHFAEPPVSL